MNHFRNVPSMEQILRSPRSLPSLGNAMCEFGMRRFHMLSDVFKTDFDKAFHDFVQECADAFFEDPQTTRFSHHVKTSATGAICLHQGRLIIRVLSPKPYCNLHSEKPEEFTALVYPGPQAKKVIAALIASGELSEEKETFYFNQEQT